MLQGILNLLQDFANMVTSFFDMLWGVGDLIAQLVTGLSGLFKWVLQALDFSREIAFMVPWDLSTVFMMMSLVSVIFVIFGRLK